MYIDLSVYQCRDQTSPPAVAAEKPEAQGAQGRCCTQAECDAHAHTSGQSRAFVPQPLPRLQLLLLVLPLTDLGERDV